MAILSNEDHDWDVTDRPGPPSFLAEGRPEHDWFSDGEPLRLRLAPDYVMGISGLWPSSDDTDAMVSPELLTRLVAWNDEFNVNFHYERGWRSEEARDRWAEESVDLAAQVRAAVEGKAELQIDLWPLSPEMRSLIERPAQPRPAP
jgi:hypothetical protein